MTDRRLSRNEKAEICRLYSVMRIPTAILAQKFSVSEAKIVRVLESAGIIKGVEGNYV